MLLKKQILLIFCLLFLSVYSMAGLLSEPENSSNTDSLRFNHSRPNHLVLTDSVVNYGKIFLKTPYHYGSPGIASFDCSGFTSHVYRNFGYNLSHSSSDQAKQFDTIDRTKLKPGDLVFFSGSRRSKRVGHVGIVTEAKENGEFDFIHAAVHSGVTISNSTEEYYTKRFVKASRVIGADQMLAISKFVSNNGNAAGMSTPIPLAVPAKSNRKVIPAEYHRVKSGETLSDISEKYGVTVAELRLKNDIKGDKLKRRQKLKIKDEETILIVQAVQPVVNNPVEVAESRQVNHEQAKAVQNKDIAQSNSSHSVQKGETLFSISRIYNISVDELKKINNILKGKIHPGQKLQISQPVEIAKNETPLRVEESSKSITHKVVAGESLSSISKAYNIPVDELKKTNSITNANIHPGQELKVTQVAESKIQPAYAERPNKKQESKVSDIEKALTYKIKKGDNLGSIAKNNNTTVEELKRANNLTDSKIHQGQVLIINPEQETHTSHALAERNDRADKKQNAKIENTEKELTHKIKKGENLGSIAKNNNTTVEELERINNLTDSKIHEGQVLIINPEQETHASHALAERTDKADKKQTAKINNSEKELTHIIKKGENLGSIAKSNNTTVEELERINNLADSKIHQGQVLKINPEVEAHFQHAVTDKSDKRQVAKVETKERELTHKVKKGESLISISKENNISVEELKRINDMTDSKIRFGQEIKLSPSSEKSKHSTRAIAETESKSIQHTVKSGESFYTLAKKYRCTVENLKEWNRKSGAKIKVGEEIIIRQRASI